MIMRLYLRDGDNKKDYFQINIVEKNVSMFIKLDRNYSSAKQPH